MDTINRVKEMLDEVKTMPDEVSSSYKTGYTQALINVISLMEYDNLSHKTITFGVFPYIDRESGARCEVFRAFVEDEMIHEMDYSEKTKSMAHYIMDFYDIQYFPIIKD